MIQVGQNFVGERIVFDPDAEHSHAQDRGNRDRRGHRQPRGPGQPPAAAQRNHVTGVRFREVRNDELGNIDGERRGDLRVERLHVRPIRPAGGALAQVPGPAVEGRVRRNRLSVFVTIHDVAIASLSLALARCSRVSTAPCFSPICSAISFVL